MPTSWLREAGHSRSTSLRIQCSPGQPARRSRAWVPQAHGMSSITSGCPRVPSGPGPELLGLNAAQALGLPAGTGGTAGHSGWGKKGRF